MTDSLATKDDLREQNARIDARFAQLDARFDHFEKHFDTRLIELEKRLVLRMDSRFAEQEARFDAKLADLERRMTMRLGEIMVAGISVVSVLVKVL